MKRASAPLVALALFMLAASSSQAGETDQFYAWRYPPGDSTRVVNALLNYQFQRGLDEVNRLPWREKMTCQRAADWMMRPLNFIEHLAERGGTRGHPLGLSPRSNTELLGRYLEYGIYRDHPPWLMFLQQPRPTMEVGGVWMGTDKLSHFLAEGNKFYVRYHEVKDAGGSEEEALDAAIMLGIEQESGLFGRVFTGVFSFADIEADAQGLFYVRELCDGDSPLLVLEPTGWRLREPIDLGRYVTPCFDESWQLNSLPDGHWRWMRPALDEYCAMRETPSIARRHRAYRKRGCNAEVAASLDRLHARGFGPSREGTRLDEVCR